MIVSNNAVLYDTIGLAGQMPPVWGGICYDDSVELCLLQNGSLTGLRYKARTLGIIACLFAGTVHPGFI